MGSNLWIVIVCEEDDFLFLKVVLLKTGEMYLCVHLSIWALFSSKRNIKNKN